MRRTNNFHVQPVRVVPPIIERRRRKHRNATPHCNERAKRPAESPNLHRRALHTRIVPKRRRQNHVRARDSHQDSRHLNHDVRRSPKRVTPNRHVPRNIPRPAIPHTTPATMHQIVHGTDSTFAPTPAPPSAVSLYVVQKESIVPCFPILRRHTRHFSCLAASLHPAARSANQCNPSQQTAQQHFLLKIRRDLLLFLPL
jgi:hypothetical protein